METDVRKLVILGIGFLLATPIAFYALDVVLPPEDAVVDQEQLPNIDPAAAQSLAYLTQKSDVAKVVVRGIQVFIGFDTRPKGSLLQSSTKQR